MSRKSIPVRLNFQQPRREKGGYIGLQNFRCRNGGCI
nr:MAG TPA: hypothetical protein [Caudoviricetes sp.]